MTNDLLNSVKLAHSRYTTQLEQNKGKLRKKRKTKEKISWKKLLRLKKGKEP